MAVTFKKDQLGVTQRNSDHLSTVQETFPEAATQTFLAGSLVIMNAAGFIAIAVAPLAGTVFGIAVEDAHNDAAAGTHDITVVRLSDDHEVYGNLLAAGPADHTLAQTDLGAIAGFVYAANLLGTGIGGWYVDVAGTGVEIVSFRGDQVPSSGRLPTNEAQVGDINARVRVRVKPATLSTAA